MERIELDADGALALAARLYGLTGGSATEMVGYDDKNFRLQPDEVVGNEHVDGLAPHGYTLKVINNVDSEYPDVIDGQNFLFQFLYDRGVVCPRPIKNKQGKTFSVEQLRPNGPGHAVRLLEFVPGDMLGRVPWQADFAVQVGRELAKLTALLDEVDVPAIRARDMPWSLWRAPDVLQHLHVVPDAARAALVSEVLDAFRRDTEAHADFLRDDAGIIHGDYNQFNLVVRRPGAGAAYSLAGVIDLGDCHWAPRVFEVALAATYMGMTSGTVEAVRDVLVGYAERRPLAPEAVGLLRVCICARLCQSLVLGLHAHEKDPSNAYVLDSQQSGWPLLLALWQAPPGTFEAQWGEALGMQRQV
ncbi:hypothetical protein ONE63_009244 [Megalurothrips usitatus]|uniref:Hydroxylysine kinase n=1 Tax=Megalurothrips usitatus TaxID=439358 RepID=A0AAV7XQP0_9NEOP|nr:hypothetical protein ONE63_009244 [Megalurothrips usitatus]